MTSDEFGSIFRLVSDGGVIGLLIAILVGGVRRWWVFGWQHEEMRKDRDEWKALALHSITTAEAGTTLAETLARRKLLGAP